MCRPSLVILIALVAVLAIACDDGMGPATTGILRVSVATTGGDLDLDGYVLTLDAAPQRAVGLNETVLVAGVDTGQHLVELRDLAGNCTVAGPHPRPVAVTAGDTAQVGFAVACVATGVQVTVATAGIDLDPDGYAVAVEGRTPVPIGVNGTVVITRLNPGIHLVTLSGVAANCPVADPNPRSVTIPSGETVPVAFAVSCRSRTGAIEVTAVSSGVELDPDGYTVQVDNGTPRSLPLNGKVTFDGLGPGDHSVTLGDAAGNCPVGGDNPRTVTVTTGGLTRDTARTTFQVTCVATSGTIEVSAATSGAELDPNGYTVFVCYYDYVVYGCYDEYGFGPVGVNGTVRFATVPVGDYGVWLVDVARNCSVVDVNPRMVTVTPGDTARVAFAVSCAQTGSMQVTAATTGLDPDPDYLVRVDGVTLDTTVAVAANASVTISGLPPGDYAVTLDGVAANCEVTSPNPRTVTVPSGGTSAVAFDVACAGLGSLQVTAATTGVDLDPNGYLVRVDGVTLDTTAAVAANASVTISGLPPGDYAVTLDGVAANCEVTNPNPRTVTVPSGGTAAVTFDVACAAARHLALALDGDVYLVKSNGSGLTQLTTHVASDGEPAWSPDGSRIAFVSFRDGNGEIYAMNADGSSPLRLTSNSVDDVQPDWSPDGSKIAFVSFRDGNGEIYSMNSDGSGVIRLTNHPAFDADPVWSPDGSKIAFSSLRDGNREIYVMNPDGSGVTRLTRNSVDDLQPDWSPDGAKLVFSRFTGCDYYGCDYDLFVMNADGSGATALTSGSSDHDAAWSPDGRWIAFGAEYCGYYGCEYTVMAVQTDGSRRVEVTYNAVQPAWRP